jgi:hypothetical protein
MTIMQFRLLNELTSTPAPIVASMDRPELR